MWRGEVTVGGNLAFGDETDDGVDCIVECLGFICGHCPKSEGGQESKFEIKCAQ